MQGRALMAQISLYWLYFIVTYRDNIENKCKRANILSIKKMIILDSARVRRKAFKQQY